MYAERRELKKLILFIGAALLLAAPMHAQLSASASSITIGQVLNCNDSQVVNITAASGTVNFNASIVYAGTDLHQNWAYVESVSSGATTHAGATVMSVTAGTPLGLIVGLNQEIGVADTATLQLTTPTTGPITQTINIPINLVPTLSCPGLTVNNGTLTAIPASLSLTAAQGQTVSQTIIISNLSSNTISGISLDPSPFFPWLGSSTTPFSLAPGASFGIPVTVSAAGLQPGTYAGTLVLNYGGGLNPQYVTVTLTVASNGVGPGITTGVQVSPSALIFNWVPGNRTPATQDLIVTNQVGTAPIPLNFGVTQFNGPANWLLTGSTANASTGFTLAVNVNTLGLVPGVTYQGTITVMPVLGPAVEVYVGLQVGAAPVVTATPTTLSFTVAQGAAAPAPQQVAISGGGNDVTYSTVAIIPGWLSANPASGGSPNGGITQFPPPGGGAWLYVFANPSGLLPGTYTGTVTVYGSGPAVGNTNILVTLVVTGPVVKSMANSASFVPAVSVSPGEMVTLFADPSGAFGPNPGVPLTGDMIANNKLPVTMGGVQVLFNNVPAPLVYVSDTQINTIVPYEISGASNVSVSVQYNGQTSAPFTLQAANMQPALFTATSTGSGQGAAGQYDLLGNYKGMNSSSNPVQRGTMITLYATGEGLTQSPVTGMITTAQSVAPYTPQPQIAPSVLIDNQPATVVFYGEVPGVVAGMMQVNVLVPTNARTGEVPVSIAMGSSFSQSGVTIVAQ